MEMILLGLALVVGFYMAWNIGANDVSNAMGTSVGSGALTMRQAVLIAAVLEFAGAFFLGSNVSQTLQKGIIDPDAFGPDPMILVYGLLASLLAAGVWLQLASYFGMPVSTTHSIVGAILGFGVVVGGVDAVQWGQVAFIVSSWVISPLLGGTIAFFVFTILRHKVFHAHYPIRAAKKITPYLVFTVMSVLSLILLFKGLKNLNLDIGFWMAFLIAVGVGLVSAWIGYLLVKRVPEPSRAEGNEDPVKPQLEISLQKSVKHLSRVKEEATGELRYNASMMVDEAKTLLAAIRLRRSHVDSASELKSVEKIFVYLQILTACFMAFAHGANDVANAIGPLAGIIELLQHGTLALAHTTPLWVLALGGIGIVIGLATWGWRVIETVGKRITELTPSRGFAAEFGAALTIVLASKLGLPVSTTHTLVGAVLGVGLARGIGAINLVTIRDIVVSWVITIPAGAVLAIGFFHLFKLIFS